MLLTSSYAETQTFQNPGSLSWAPLVSYSSGDSTARIWHIPEGPSGDAAAQAAAPKPLVLKHFRGKTNEKSKDVTTLDWNVSGPNYDVTTLAWHVSRPSAALSQRAPFCAVLVCGTFAQAHPSGFSQELVLGRSMVVGRLPDA
jgi:hypothetical protein